ncbi:hypothetical protein HK102_005491 [Quaeritorhiza haematococci]|nr:hypothetical protein HK102_005491 [Quaeritorhiza haematococci]
MAHDTLSKIKKWDKGRIVGMGWTNTEHLVCVLEYGSVRVYDIHGDFVMFSLGQDAKDYGVIDCHVWETGVVVLTGNYKLVCVTDLDEPRPKNLADPGLTQPPHSWAIIPPQYTLSRHLEILIAVNQTILLVDSDSVQDQLLNQGPFTRMAVSPNGSFLALFNGEGRMWVVSTDFQKNLSRKEFMSHSSDPPLQMTWCGTDSVVLHWEDMVVMVGPFANWIKILYEGVVHLVPEVDGVRIISNEKCEFLQRVPVATESIFKIGSTAPGAILYDALDHFERKSPRADENIRSIKLELGDAVSACIEAAGHELQPQRQKQLLRAASFGKAFLEAGGFERERFAKMCRVLRVLNAVRGYDVGMPITYAQYQKLTPEILVNRLVHRHHHLLALRICDYLKLNRDRVLIHWACAKIKRSVEDEDTLCRIIVDKLSVGGSGAGSGSRSGMSPDQIVGAGISYAEVAKAAFQAGQTRLATKLLDYEPQAANQVPLLMSMQEDEVALVKAIESGDTDLVYLVMLHLKRKHPPADFFRLINGRPLAISLLQAYARQTDLQLLKDFYYQDDRRWESANVMVLESYEQVDLTARSNKLKIAMKLYQDDKEHAFESKATDEQTKLLTLQTQLERETAHSFVGLSVSETISKCLLLGQGNKAAKVKGEFRVPDRRFWWLKIRALIQSHNWDGLEKFAKSSQKFGYVGIIDTLLKNNQFAQAAKYVEMMAKSEKDTHLVNRYMEILRNVNAVRPGHGS